MASGERSEYQIRTTSMSEITEDIGFDDGKEGCNYEECDTSIDNGAWAFLRSWTKGRQAIPL